MFTMSPFLLYTVLAVSKQLALGCTVPSGNPPFPPAPKSVMKLQIPTAEIGVFISGWLFRPVASNTKAPLVIMAHGFGGSKACGLTTMGADFASHGFAALPFDYRNLGESGGTDPKVVDPEGMVDDFLTVLRYAHSRFLENIVDANRIVIWSTCYGAGSAVVAAQRAAAARLPYAGVILQTPNIDVLAIPPPQTPLTWAAHAAWLETKAAEDYLTHNVGVLTIATPDEPDDQYVALPGSAIAAAMCPAVSPPASMCMPARSMLKIMKIDRAKALKSLTVPVLMLPALYEQVVQSAENLEGIVKGMGNVEIHRLYSEHFSVYPMQNPELYARLKKQMTKPSNTYNLSVYPASLGAQVAWLANHFDATKNATNDVPTNVSHESYV